MKSIKHFWATSPPEYKDYLFIYSWGALWSLVYLIATPASTLNTFSVALVVLWTLVSTLGGILAATGLVTRDNLILERLGVNLMMLGPVAFALTQFALMLIGFISGVGDPIARLHLIFFALWPYLFLNKRRRQLNARLKLVKQIPTNGESE